MLDVYSICFSSRFVRLFVAPVCTCNWLVQFIDPVVFWDVRCDEKTALLALDEVVTCISLRIAAIGRGHNFRIF